MSSFLAALHLDDPASLKRFLVMLLGVLLMLLSPLLEKVGLPKPDDTQLALVASLLAGFILQSGAKSAVVAHAEAVTATPAPTPSEAEKSLAAAVEAGK